jgi:hypothetical protein
VRRLLAACLGVAAACGDVTAPLQVADVVGTYALATIGGVPIPPPPAGLTGLLSSEFTYAPDGTWRAREVYGSSGTNGPEPITAYSGGVWTLDARRATLRQTTTTGRGQVVVEYRVEERGRVLVGPDGASGRFRYVQRP